MSREEEKLFFQSEYPEEELVGMDLYDLLRTFKRIWERHQDKLEKPRHVIKRYPYTVEQVKYRLLERVLMVERIDFVSFILEEKERIYVVFSFLAILELVQTQKLNITIGQGFNNFWLSKKDEED